MNRAANVLNNAVETGKNMASELVSTARPGSQASGANPPPATQKNASSPAHDIKDPGGSGETL
jgi:hypothetical protein